MPVPNTNTNTDMPSDSGDTQIDAILYVLLHNWKDTNFNRFINNEIIIELQKCGYDIDLSETDCYDNGVFVKCIEVIVSTSGIIIKMK